MAIYKDKDTWRFRKQWTDKQGITHKLAGTPLINTKKAAELAEHKAIEEEEHPKPATPDALSTFQAFTDDYVKTYVSANSKASDKVAKETILKLHLLPSFGILTLDAINASGIEHLKASMLEKDYSRKTVNNVLAVLSKILNYAAELEILKSIPKIKMLKTEPSKFDFFEFGDWEKLVSASSVEPETYAAVLLAGEAGLRLGEIIGLEQSDVDFKTGVLTVLRNDWHGVVAAPKGGKARKIKLTRRTLAALQAIRHLRHKRFLWHMAGGRWTFSTMRAVLKRQLKRAGLRHAGWHVLRHTFASHLAIRGAAAIQIQKLLGHQSIQMTERYMHLAPGATDTAMALLEQEG